MQTEYTEMDTERVRAAQRSSAGQQTQSLTWPGDQHVDERPPTRTSIGIVALTLIAIGVLLIGRFIAVSSGFAVPLLPAGLLPSQGEFEGGMVLLTIASSFLFFAFWHRIYLLLIPGCILAGLSVGVAFAGMTSGVSVLWGLSFGFISILMLGRGLFRIRSAWASWPIFPAIPLFASGVIVALSNMPFFFSGWFAVLPLLLIVVGLYLGWGRRG